MGPASDLHLHPGACGSSLVRCSVGPPSCSSTTVRWQKQGSSSWFDRCTSTCSRCPAWCSSSLPPAPPGRQSPPRPPAAVTGAGPALCHYCLELVSSHAGGTWIVVGPARQEGNCVVIHRIFVVDGVMLRSRNRLEEIKVQILGNHILMTQLGMLGLLTNNTNIDKGW